MISHNQKEIRLGDAVSATDGIDIIEGNVVALISRNAKLKIVINNEQITIKDHIVMVRDHTIKGSFLFDPKDIYVLD